MMDFKKESMQETGMNRYVAKPNLLEDQLVLGRSGGGMSFETKLNALSENVESTEPKTRCNRLKE